MKSISWKYFSRWFLSLFMTPCFCLQQREQCGVWSFSFVSGCLLHHFSFMLTYPSMTNLFARNGGNRLDGLFLKLNVFKSPKYHKWPNFRLKSDLAFSHYYAQSIYLGYLLLCFLMLSKAFSLLMDNTLFSILSSVYHEDYIVLWSIVTRNNFEISHYWKTLSSQAMIYFSKWLLCHLYFRNSATCLNFHFLGNVSVCMAKQRID